ncbi:MAG: hypothetical protein ACRYHQ_31225 [Janthinobacterium lividum]
MMALPPADRNRLAGILGMLGSSHQGERDAAALAADRFVRSRGIAWPDLLAEPATQPASATGGSRPTGTVEDDLAVCRRNLRLLTPWERDFLVGLKPGRSLSPKQRQILAGMGRKVRGA